MPGTSRAAAMSWHSIRTQACRLSDLYQCSMTKPASQSLRWSVRLDRSDFWDVLITAW